MSAPVSGPAHIRECQLALLKMVKSKALLCLQQHMQGTIEAADIVPRTVPIYSHWMSFVLMSTDDFQLILKSHFNNSDMEDLIKRRLRKKDLVVSQELFEGFMNEFLNLFSAKVKHCLLDVQINVGLSLPLITRGYDNFFFESSSIAQKNPDDQISATNILQSTEVWLYKIDSKPIYCSYDMTVTAASMLEKLYQLKDLKEEDESQASNKMEFL